MTKRSYREYIPGLRNYALLSDEQKLQLSEIVPSQSDDLKLWPCKVILDSGLVVENTYIADSSSYIGYWGVWPEDDPAKYSIDISNVVKIEASPNRLPAYLANKLYSAGESGMGYLLFTVIFSDGSEQAYFMGNALDFIELPAGKKMTDVVDVLPNQGNEADCTLEDTEFYWCLFKPNH